jgi:hypothetical protein
MPTIKLLSMAVCFTSSSDFVSATARKLESFRSLPVGWHYGHGDPLNVDVIEKALEMDGYYRNLGFTSTDAFPAADGEVMITAYRGSHCIETTISTDLLYSVTYEDDGAEISATPNDIDEVSAKRKVLQIGAEIWLGLLGLSMEATTIKRGGGSQDSRSRTLKVGGFLSSVEIAWTPQGSQFAGTSGHITPSELLESHRFTGSSENQYFLVNTG